MLDRKTGVTALLVIGSIRLLDFMVYTLAAATASLAPPPSKCR
jgi:hypothetical protein